MIENPHSSRLWCMPAFKHARSIRHVEFNWTDFCQDGTPWRKRTAFLSTGLVFGIKLKSEVARTMRQRSPEAPMVAIVATVAIFAIFAIFAFVICARALARVCYTRAVTYAVVIRVCTHASCGHTRKHTNCYTRITDLMCGMYV